MATQGQIRFRLAVTLIGAIVLGALAIVGATAVVMGGIAFVAPVPLLLFGVPSVLLFRSLAKPPEHDIAREEEARNVA